MLSRFVTMQVCDDAAGAAAKDVNDMVTSPCCRV